ncbi:MAG: helix-turn-helix domain-containing protein [Spirochaetaceae bacterium]|jgi:transcriptional regulator with XRE-family HTH domain|nr:helix-turn-helix domain-containing protein [Spirochaetaceae bacterium]
MPLTNRTDILKARFGDNLRIIRTKSKLSQLKLAMRIGLSHNFINDIERGRKSASFGTIAALSEALKVDACQFFMPIEDKPGEDNYDGRYPDHIEGLLKAVEDIKDHYNQ